MSLKMVEKNWNQLKACELIPFTENFAKADSIMIAHVTVNNVTGDGLPASLSKELASRLSFTRHGVYDEHDPVVHSAP